MPARRLEARLQTPLPPDKVGAALQKAVQRLGGVPAPAAPDYFEARVGDGGPRDEDPARLPRSVWAVWWRAEGMVHVDLLVEDHVTGPPTDALREAVRGGLLAAYETCRGALRAQTKDMQIVPASKPPVRPRRHTQSGEAPAAPEDAAPRFERMNVFSHQDAGLQARCPHCGGFSNHKEPGQVLCHFCSQWFTLQG